MRCEISVRFLFEVTKPAKGNFKNMYSVRPEHGLLQSILRHHCEVIVGPHCTLGSLPKLLLHANTTAQMDTGIEIFMDDGEGNTNSREVGKLSRGLNKNNLCFVMTRNKSLILQIKIGFISALSPNTTRCAKPTNFLAQILKQKPL